MLLQKYKIKMIFSLDYFKIFFFVKNRYLKLTNYSLLQNN